MDCGDVNMLSLPDRNDKENKIRNLGNKIIDNLYKPYSFPNDEVWFYPEYNGVKGFLGTQEIIFLGLNPSKGNFPSPSDEFFYKQLRKNGFSDAHLTDLTKLRIYTENTKEIRGYIRENRYNQIDYLLKEIKIIEPKIIVPMGEESKKLFEEIKDNRHIQITTRTVPHYSQRKTEIGKRKLKEFEQEMKSIRREFRYLKKSD